MAAAAGRQLGRVKKFVDNKQWSARFQFNRGGERTSMYGPLRASRDLAEQDRERIAAAMSLQPGPSKMQAAERELGCLRGLAPASNVVKKRPASSKTVKKRPAKRGL